MSNTTRLLDRKKLFEIHPALSKGYRLDWLIRNRQIPIVKIGRRVYFEEEAVNIWIKERSVPAQDGD